MRSPRTRTTRSRTTSSRTTRTRSTALLVGVLTATPLLVSAPASAAAPQRSPSLADVFADGHAWQRDVRGLTPRGDSAALVADVAQQVSSRYGGVAAFNAYSYGTSTARASASTPRTDVVFDDCQGKGHVPTGLYGSGGVFEDVPIPSDAVPAAGSDGQLTVHDPATDRLWEFWRAAHRDGRWHACWGGRIDRVSRSGGAFAAPWGSSGSGLAASAGSVGLAEARGGRIDHALALQLVDVGKGAPIAPATRNDGWVTRSSAAREGQRFRLDPKVDVEALPGLTPLGRSVARAAQQYGFVVTDASGAVALTAESGAAEQRRTGVDPWKQVLGSTPSYDALRGFPWSRLQALPADTTPART